MDPTQFDTLMGGLTVINGNIVTLNNAMWLACGMLAVLIVSDLLDFFR